MPYPRKIHSKYVINRYHAIRQVLIGRLGGRCSSCGSETELEFDHINPTTKSFSLGKLNSKSAEDIETEVLKCQLLCHTCHIEKHAPKHGTYSRYRSDRYLCRCQQCVTAARIYNKNYNLKKRSRIG